MAESNYGLDVEQTRKYIVAPAVQLLGLHSPAADVLVLGTGLVESELRYIDQLDVEDKPGPAFGLFQMERATHNDIWRNFLDYQAPLRARVLAHVTPASMVDNGIPDAASMQWNHLYAAMMCRLLYRRIPAALPAADDALALAAYWKRHYNTHLGKGTVEKAIKHFKRATLLPTGAKS